MNAGFQLKAVTWVRKKDLGLSCFHARIGSSDPARDLEILFVHLILNQTL